MSDDDPWGVWADVYAASDSERSYDAHVRFASTLRTRAEYLDLGCGTGGLASAMARAGYVTSAVDLSQSMLEHARRTGSDDVQWAVGDMSRWGESSAFDLTTCVASTLFSLPDQDRQFQFFENVRRILRSNGQLVIETYIPTQHLLFPARNLVVRDVTADSVALSATVTDRVRQRVEFQEVRLSDGAPPRLLPVRQRFAWPAEIDLMARAAGLVKTEEYQDFNRRPLTSAATSRVAIYQKRNTN